MALKWKKDRAKIYMNYEYILSAQGGSNIVYQSSDPATISIEKTSGRAIALKTSSNAITITASASGEKITQSLIVSERNDAPNTQELKWKNTVTTRSTGDFKLITATSSAKEIIYRSYNKNSLIDRYGSTRVLGWYAQEEDVVAFTATVKTLNKKGEETTYSIGQLITITGESKTPREGKGFATVLSGTTAAGSKDSEETKEDPVKAPATPLDSSKVIEEYVHVIEVSSELIGTRPSEQVEQKWSASPYKNSIWPNFMVNMIYDSLKNYYKGNKSHFDKHSGDVDKIQDYAGSNYKVFPRISYFNTGVTGCFWDGEDKSERVVGKKLQNNHPQKLKQLATVYNIVTKAHYIMRYGTKAKIQYDYDKKSDTSNYKKMLGGATAFLWLEAENGQGFHRGIDFYQFYGAPVHSLCKGTVVELRGKDGVKNNRANYFALTIKSDDKVHYTYMHLDVLDGIKAGSEITLGQQIGTEGRRESHLGYEAEKNDKGIYYVAHTHFEVNSKNPSDFTMAWSGLNYWTKPFYDSTRYYYVENSSKRTRETDGYMSSRYRNLPYAMVNKYFSDNPYIEINKGVKMIFK